MADFNQAVEKVLTHEGGWTPGLLNDPGGETNFGISKRAYPDVDIKNLTREGAIEIYKRDYWKDWMENNSDQSLANCQLDCAVNEGVETAWKLHITNNANLQSFQTARLLRYIHLIVSKPQLLNDAHSWVSRTLDV